MRAMQVHELGTPLQLTEVDPPEPTAGEVRIQVSACGINFADLLMVSGQYQEKPEPPFTPGLEVAGMVDAVGVNVTDVALGTRVAAMCGAGGYAEFVCAKAAACVSIPDNMPDTTAAGLQVAYGTSEVALHHRANLQPNETLLVLGAAGGVGLTAVEVGKLMGARVIACARGPARLEVLRDRGADVCIDTDQEDIRESVLTATDGRGADVIFDPVGGEQFRAALRCAAFEARILPIGFASGDVPQIPANIVLVKNVTIIGLYWGAYYRHQPEVLADSFRRIMGWHENGEIQPHVSHTLPLADANDALELLRNRKAIGKMVLQVQRCCFKEISVL